MVIAQTFVLFVVLTRHPLRRREFSKIHKPAKERRSRENRNSVKYANPSCRSREGGNPVKYATRKGFPHLKQPKSGQPKSGQPQGIAPTIMAEGSNHNLCALRSLSYLHRYRKMAYYSNPSFPRERESSKTRKPAKERRSREGGNPVKYATRKGFLHLKQPKSGQPQGIAPTIMAEELNHNLCALRDLCVKSFIV